MDFEVIKHTNIHRKSKDLTDNKKEQLVFQPIKNLEIKFDNNSYKKKMSSPFRKKDKPEELKPLRLKKLNLMSSSLSHAQITDKARR